MALTRAALALLAGAAACVTESVERCPSPLRPVAVELTTDADAITRTEVTCEGLGSFCHDWADWSVDVGGGCGHTVVSICTSNNFAIYNCLEMYLGTEVGAPVSGALLVFQDDVGGGVDAVLDAVGGRIELAGFSGDDVRGRFDLTFRGGDSVRGTFALAGPRDAATP